MVDVHIGSYAFALLGIALFALAFLALCSHISLRSPLKSHARSNPFKRVVLSWGTFRVDDVAHVF